MTYPSAIDRLGGARTQMGYQKNAENHIQCKVYTVQAFLATENCHITQSGLYTTCGSMACFAESSQAYMPPTSRRGRHC